jgi:hypothetical protein
VEDPDDFDDLPSTHLEDDEYEAFLRRELDAEGRPRESLPVTAILVALIVVVLALAFVVLGG